MKKLFLILFILALTSCEKYYNVIITDIKCSGNECIVSVENEDFKTIKIGYRDIIKIEKSNNIYRIGQKVTVKKVQTFVDWIQDPTYTIYTKEETK